MNAIIQTSSSNEIGVSGTWPDLTALSLTLFKIDNNLDGMSEEVVRAAREIVSAPGWPTLLTEARRSSEPGPRSEQKKIVALLIAAYPFAAEKADLAAFARLLVEDVANLNPSAVALDTACRRLRQTSKFLPSIAEVIAAVVTSQAEQRHSVHRLEHLPRLVERLEERLADEQRWAAIHRERFAEDED